MVCTTASADGGEDSYAGKGTCKPGCRLDSECGEGFLCEWGACNRRCLSNADCANDSVCSDHYVDAFGVSCAEIRSKASCGPEYRCECSELRVCRNGGPNTSPDTQTEGAPPKDASFDADPNRDARIPEASTVDRVSPGLDASRGEAGVSVMHD
jgi:hypothetical protein